MRHPSRCGQILNLGAKSPVDGGCEFFYSNSPIAIRLAGAIDFSESSYVEWPGLRQQQNPHPGKGETFVPMLRFSMLASLIAAALAMTPSASATNYNLFVGSTLVATASVTTGGSCASGDICVTIDASSGYTIREGGPTLGFSGSGLTGLGISLAGFSSGTCGGMQAETLCFDTTGSGTVSSLTFDLTGAGTATVVSDLGLHVAGAACGSSPTCFASSSPMGTVPEPSTLIFLGTGLVGIVSTVRRRFGS